MCIRDRFFDTLIFCTIAFAGTITLLELANYTVTGFLYKTAVEILIVPVTLAVIRVLKRIEPTYRPANPGSPSTTAATA